VTWDNDDGEPTNNNNDDNDAILVAILSIIIGTSLIAITAFGHAYDNVPSINNRSKLSVPYHDRWFTL
jgi:hypothetical protein